MKILKTLTLLLAVPLTLAGCNGLESDFRDNAATAHKEWEPKVDTQTRQFEVDYKSGQTGLSKHQAMHLKQIALSTDGEAKIFASILTHDVSDRLQREPLKSRVNTLIRYLISVGVPRGSIDVVSQASATAGAGSNITVVIEQSKVVPIKCQGWNYNVGSKIAPEGEPDFGCSNAANLSAMINNPRDLVQGRVLDSGDPTRVDVFTQRYRDDQIRPILKNEKISAK